MSLVPPPTVCANAPPAIPNVITAASTAMDALLTAGRLCLVNAPVFASVVASIAALVVLVIVISSLWTSDALIGVPLVSRRPARVYFRQSGQSGSGEKL